MRSSNGKQMILGGYELNSVFSPSFWDKMHSGKLVKEGNHLVNIIDYKNIKVKQYLRKAVGHKSRLFGILKKEVTEYYPYVQELKIKDWPFTEKVTILSRPREIDYGTYWIEGDPHGFRPYAPEEFEGRGERMRIHTVFIPDYIVLSNSKESKLGENEPDAMDKLVLSGCVKRVDTIWLGDEKKLVLILEKSQIPIVMHWTHAIEKGDHLEVLGTPMGWV